MLLIIIINQIICKKIVPSCYHIYSNDDAVINSVKRRPKRRKKNCFNWITKIKTNKVRINWFRTLDGNGVCSNILYKIAYLLLNILVKSLSDPIY